MLILDQKDFTARKINWNKKRHDVVMKGSIIKEDITTLNLSD